MPDLHIILTTALLWIAGWALTAYQCERWKA